MYQMLLIKPLQVFCRRFNQGLQYPKSTFREGGLAQIQMQSSPGAIVGELF